MRSPFLPIAVAFILGILFSNSFCPHLIHTFIASAILIILILLLYFKSKIFLSFLSSIIVFFLFGCIAFIINQEILSSNQLLNLWKEKKNTELNQPVEIYGVINKSPEIRWYHLYLIIELDKIVTPSECYKINGGISLKVNLWSQHFANFYHFEYGDYIRTIVHLYEPHNYMNEGCFDYKNYLARQKIYLVGSIESPLLIEVLKKREADAIQLLCQKIRNNLSGRIDYYFSTWKGQLTQEGAFIKSITLGERGKLSSDFRSELLKAGTFHILAISGLHIVIISYFLYYFLSFLRISERLSCIIIIIFVIFYALFTGARIPVLRAMIMTTIYLLGRLLSQESNMLNSLCLACLVILIYKPDQLFDAGFQLSFASTLFIILLAPKLISLLRPWPLKLGEIFAITLAAQIGLIPILIYHFHRISLIAPISNLMTFPLIWLAIILGFFFIISSFSLPEIAEVIAITSQYLIKAFYYLLKYLNNIPYSHQRIPTPFLWLIVFYYFSLILFIVYGYKKKFGKISLAAWLITLLLLIIFPFPPHVMPYLTVTFLDVGRGDSILIEFPGREKMLVDGGGSARNISYIGENVVSPYLWHKRIKQLDIVALSHAHVDHLGGLLAIIDNFNINEIWQGNPPRNNWLYEQFIRKTRVHKIKTVSLFKGYCTTIHGVKIEVLNPSKKRPVPAEEINNDSLVFMLTYGRHKILLTADIEAEAEKELVKQYGSQLQCFVLKASHHASATSNTDEFLAAANPKIFIISGWLPYRQKYQQVELIRNIHQQGFIILRTIEHGQITLKTDGNNIQISTFELGQ